MSYSSPKESLRSAWAVHRLLRLLFGLHMPVCVWAAPEAPCGLQRLPYFHWTAACLGQVPTCRQTIFDDPNIRGAGDHSDAADLDPILGVARFAAHYQTVFSQISVRPHDGPDEVLLTIRGMPCDLPLGSLGMHCSCRANPARGRWDRQLLGFRRIPVCC